MQLLSSPTSPFARKARVMILERGLDVAVVGANPFGTTEEVEALRRANPLGKIPALILDDGRALFDSPVICEYLDSLGDAAPLAPRSGPARWNALRRQALGDGVAEAGFNIVMEGRRPADQRSDAWAARWRGAILSSAAALEGELSGDAQPFDLGAITLACAFGYIRFRLPDIDWSVGNPKLSAWIDSLLARDSLAATAPPT
eukprot:gene19454-19876_t